MEKYKWETELASSGEIKTCENENLRIGRLTGKEGASERLERKVGQSVSGWDRENSIWQTNFLL